MSTYQTPKYRFYISDPATEVDPFGKIQANLFQVESIFDFTLSLYASENIAARDAVNLECQSLYASGIDLSPSSDFIVGTGTSFTTDLAVGSVIRIGSLSYTFQVVEIVNDTSLYVDYPYLGDVAVLNQSMLHLRSRKAYLPTDYPTSPALPAVGLAKNSVSVGQICRVKTRGLMDGFTGLSAGRPYILSSAVGAIEEHPGGPVRYYQEVGQALSSDTMFVKCQPIHRPFLS